jgi:thiamine biosynthesis protein ThiS
MTTSIKIASTHDLRYHPSVMQIKVNGEDKELADGATVAQLLEALGMQGKPVAIEINKILIPRKQHDSAIVSAGDVIEIVTFVGGG